MEWDDAKDQSNRAKHGVSFDLIEGFDWESALTREDARGDYGERRFVSLGEIDNRLYVAVWTMRETIRLISLRKANKREQRIYDEA
jgi:Uncharacterized protein conserved in bacteria